MYSAIWMLALNIITLRIFPWLLSIYCNLIFFVSVLRFNTCCVASNSLNEITRSPKLVYGVKGNLLHYFNFPGSGVSLNLVFASPIIIHIVSCIVLFHPLCDMYFSGKYILAEFGSLFQSQLHVYFFSCLCV